MPIPAEAAPGPSPPQAPADPRDEWDLPPSGALPVVARLDQLVSRVLAPNASPMTLDGTNTYVIVTPGGGEAAVVDPGPDDEAHLARVEAVVEATDAQCRWVVVTHFHADHAEAAAPLAKRLGAQVAAASPAMAGASGRLVTYGERLPIAGMTVEVVATPGHTADHIALRLENDAVLVGDHVLGRGTSVVAHPDGNLVAYLESLRRLLHLGAATLYPGHGPELRTDPTAVVQYYLAHRRFREQQVLSVLASAEAGLAVSDLVRRIYGDVDAALCAAAEQSTRAVLVKLHDEGAVALADDGSARLERR